MVAICIGGEGGILSLWEGCSLSITSQCGWSECSEVRQEDRAHRGSTEMWECDSQLLANALCLESGQPDSAQ